jgi:hypothetical protein
MEEDEAALPVLPWRWLSWSQAAAGRRPRKSSSTGARDAMALAPGRRDDVAVAAGGGYVLKAFSV